MSINFTLHFGFNNSCSYFLRLFTNTHHVRYFQVSVREDYGVRRGGHRQHEGKRCTEGAGDHNIQRIDTYRLGLIKQNNIPLNQLLLLKHTIY